MFADYVKEQLMIRRVQNINEVQTDVKLAWVQEKLDSFIERWNGMFDKKELENKIITDPAFACMFAKEPLKQNLTEKLCGEYIGAKKLPSVGRKAVRFDDNGDIQHIAIGCTKSADFEIDGVYYTQKYTGGKGGAQDNQFNDVVDFLKRGSIQHQVGAIVDGEYWDEFGNRERLITLFQDNPNVRICSADDFV